MPLAPPGVARRWAVVGRTHDHWECTTLFDLPDDDRTTLVVHPAAVPTYSLRLCRDAVSMLVSTIGTGDACAVPGEHAVHGRRLLGLRPVTLPGEPSWTARPADAPPYRGPMELYLRLPDAQLFIVFARERLLRLSTVLSEILTELGENPVAR